VPRAKTFSSTSSARGILRVCTRRISSRPRTSGRFTTTRRSKRPGRRSAESSTSDGSSPPSGSRLRSIRSRPFHQQLIQSLLAFIVSTAEPSAAVTSDGVNFVEKTMHGAFFCALFETCRARRLAPTPTNISTKSEPEMEKNGTFASPATRAQPARSCPFPEVQPAIRPLECVRQVSGTSALSRRNSIISRSSSLRLIPRQPRL